MRPARYHRSRIRLTLPLRLAANSITSASGATIGVVDRLPQRAGDALGPVTAASLKLVTVNVASTRRSSSRSNASRRAETLRRTMQPGRLRCVLRRHGMQCALDTAPPPSCSAARDVGPTMRLRSRHLSGCAAKLQSARNRRIGRQRPGVSANGPNCEESAKRSRPSDSSRSSARRT